MSETLLIALRWAHILGACVLIGTGAGIAFFMLMADRSGEPKVIAHVARTVVIADFVFTASAVVVQPITGALLAHATGWSLLEPWIATSIALYLLIGALWLPVVRMQIRMRDLAQAAADGGTPLPRVYHAIYRRWFLFGWPAFAAILIILWLMIARPTF